jgi:hypothetical protein
MRGRESELKKKAPAGTGAEAKKKRKPFDR